MQTLYYCSQQKTSIHNKAIDQRIIIENPRFFVMRTSNAALQILSLYTFLAAHICVQWSCSSVIFGFEITVAYLLEVTIHACSVILVCKLIYLRLLQLATQHFASRTTVTINRGWASLVLKFDPNWRLYSYLILDTLLSFGSRKCLKFWDYDASQSIALSKSVKIFSCGSLESRSLWQRSWKHL